MTQDDTAVRILLEGEYSSMASSWTEYLCLSRDGDRVVLSSRGYEVLGDIYSFEVDDDEGNVEHELPDTIDGKTVVGIEDGEYVIGGDLVPHDDDAVIRLQQGDIKGARDWLEGREWHLKPGYEVAWKEIVIALGKIEKSDDKVDPVEPPNTAHIAPVTQLRIRLLRWMDFPASDENDYPAEVIKEGETLNYSARGVTIPITEHEAVQVISNPFLYYFSTALKLHQRIEAARSSPSTE